MHKSITQERVIALVEQNETTLSNLGLCTTCGEEQEGCEPDAHHYECENCGARQVFGAEELLIRMV